MPPDVKRFCRKLVDQGDFTVLACLKENRPKFLPRAARCWSATGNDRGKRTFAEMLGLFSASKANVGRRLNQLCMQPRWTTRHFASRAAAVALPAISWCWDRPPD